MAASSPQAGSASTNKFAETFKSTRVTSIGCLGGGHVGVSTIAVLAKKCPDIKFTIFDDNPAVVCACQAGPLPFYEPGLDELVSELRNKNLFFSPSVQQTVRDAQVVFVCINTPVKSSGVGAGSAADLSGWESMARRIAENAGSDPKIVVECSTMPVQTAETMRKVFDAVGHAKYEVLCFPSFYRGGSALKYLQQPQKVLLGSNDTVSGLVAYETFRDILSPWIAKEKIVHSNLWSAELAKLSQNAMVAQRISSANAVSALCEKTGADLDEVMKVVGSDSRISDGYLSACPSMGGATLLQNLAMLIYVCDSLQLHEVADYWRKVLKMNEYQRTRFSDNIVNTMVNVKGKKICVLGFAYKPDTSDTRESPAISVCQAILSEGAKVAIYDPQVSMEQVTKVLGEHNPLTVTCCTSAEEAIKDSHAVVLVTAWPEFQNLDMNKVAPTRALLLVA
mmetsp:Transcript_6362/g.10040  ORF Transcript_6362/g.10040 Transcript_6362/m.10040 type:complete len:451 (+) Transcript_6362:49-1401(+)